jgi:hypothetical protein
MGIREQAQADMGRILGDPEGPGTPFELIDTDGLVYPVAGTYGDIGLLIDPATGTAVQGQTITAAYPMALLAEHTDNKPEKGWKVKVTDLKGGEHLLRIIDPPIHDFTVGITRLQLGDPL